MLPQISPPFLRIDREQVLGFEGTILFQLRGFNAYLLFAITYVIIVEDWIVYHHVTLRYTYPPITKGKLLPRLRLYSELAILFAAFQLIESVHVFSLNRYLLWLVALFALSSVWELSLIKLYPTGQTDEWKKWAKVDGATTVSYLLLALIFPALSKPPLIGIFIIVIIYGINRFLERQGRPTKEDR